MQNIKKITPYQNINEVLCFLTESNQKIFQESLIGFYLTGSLSYGDFDEKRSDIDLAAVIQKPATIEEVEKLRKLYIAIEEKYPKWAKKIECSHIPLSMLENTLPPKESRPYFGAGIFYPSIPYGNEWLINQYFLYNNGIALTGPEFKTFIKPIRISEMKKAASRDLHEEWEPKIKDRKWLDDSHQQSYLVLNLCRILYLIICGKAVSKKVASTWAQTEYPEWKNLIEEADDWHYGIKMKRQKEVVEFIKFTLIKTQKQNSN